MRHTFINFIIFYISIIAVYFIFESRFFYSDSNNDLNSAVEEKIVQKYQYRNDNLIIDFDLNGLKILKYSTVKYNESQNVDILLSNKQYREHEILNERLIFVNDDGDKIILTFDKYFISVNIIENGHNQIIIKNEGQISGGTNGMYINVLNDKSKVSSFDWISKSSDTFSICIVIGDLQKEIVQNNVAIGGNIKQIYLGPKNLFELTKNSDLYLIEQTIYYGILSFLVFPLSQIVHKLYYYIPNYGIIIILLTLIFRILTFFIMYQSHKSISKMHFLQDRFDFIERKFKQGTSDYNNALQKLYKFERIDPWARFWSQIVQFPIFYLLSGLFAYDVIFKDAGFLYLKSLSASDSWVLFNLYFFNIKLLPLIFGLIMFIQNNYFGSNKTYYYTLPLWICFSVLFNNFAAGLLIYMILNSILGLIGEVIVRLIIKN